MQQWTDFNKEIQKQNNSYENNEIACKILIQSLLIDALILVVSCNYM